MNIRIRKVIRSERLGTRDPLNRMVGKLAMVEPDFLVESSTSTDEVLLVLEVDIEVLLVV